MAVWEQYPAHYRAKEVEQLLQAVRTGECAAVLGLSGSGKSNLAGFLAGRSAEFAPMPVLVSVDCNRLSQPEPVEFYRLVLRAMGEPEAHDNNSPLECLARSLDRQIEIQGGSINLLFDRFDTLMPWGESALFGNLRALRDDHKYRLTYIITSRRPLAPQTELAELFYGHTFWLGPLSNDDARWSAADYAQRAGLTWSEKQLESILEISGGYPSFLRAVCQAAAGGSGLSIEDLLLHPAVESRLAEFWSDQPDGDTLRASGLAENLLLAAWRRGSQPPVDLTAKEQRLLDYFTAHAGQICEKDDLLVGVWPEDQVFDRGLRDDSLAQLVRRLREKIETDPSHPVQIQTVPGRGYSFHRNKK